ncbi:MULTISPECIES: excisionase family DNA-binding protein [Streptomyces]|uniref:Excisionase family DNA binding protein n=1 Tax=Streptomyces stelliscabiei TaxID=146820 RepID=A0A8I0P3R7_9ACTN|nr:excisionase family DNA-binding protein [Streptomyces stelliscabiei]MBE1596724.1 excisionase family DNA binding protein [Streptomyces stelliscabiei]MDX2514531.1 excisionase family DNA-binding protein [Streptomyces stelliscabiei]MDX2551232.1 excisionase family DNA-binding protein [Streptomyces stelliscabiei]MDX2615302.1 excisionase family DNA-binding protein [Streptomyces stelliscabiei]MDX2633892.1 excisionase family DNA-binding protein [Streptomyces stelliscabiei]
MPATHQEQKPAKQKKHPTDDSTTTLSHQIETSRTRKKVRKRPTENPPALRGTQAQRTRKEQRKRSVEEAVPCLRDALTSSAETFHITVAEAGKATIEVPREALAVLMETMALITSGRAVEVIPKSMELSTIQAAKTLGVSRPHLVKLLDKGVIDFRMVGTHRRVDVASLEGYRRREQNEQAQRRRAAVASAIGSTEAEGLRVSADTAAGLDAYARGELDAAALRARTLARYTRKAAE